MLIDPCALTRANRWVAMASIIRSQFGGRRVHVASASPSPNRSIAGSYRRRLLNDGISDPGRPQPTTVFWSRRYGAFARAVGHLIILLPIAVRKRHTIRAASRFYVSIRVRRAVLPDRHWNGPRLCLQPAGRSDHAPSGTHRRLQGNFGPEIPPPRGGRAWSIDLKTCGTFKQVVGEAVVVGSTANCPFEIAAGLDFVAVRR